jgi:hypothetical protein
MTGAFLVEQKVRFLVVELAGKWTRFRSRGCVPDAPGPSSRWTGGVPHLSLAALSRRCPFEGEFGGVGAPSHTDNIGAARSFLVPGGNRAIYRAALEFQQCPCHAQDRPLGRSHDLRGWPSDRPHLRRPHDASLVLVHYDGASPAPSSYRWSLCDVQRSEGAVSGALAEVVGGGEVRSSALISNHSIFDFRHLWPKHHSQDPLLRSNMRRGNGSPDTIVAPDRSGTWGGFLTRKESLGQRGFVRGSFLFDCALGAFGFPIIVPNHHSQGPRFPLGSYAVRHPVDSPTALLQSSGPDVRSGLSSFMRSACVADLDNVRAQRRELPMIGWARADRDRCS